MCVLGGGGGEGGYILVAVCACIKIKRMLIVIRYQMSVCVWLERRGVHTSGCVCMHGNEKDVIKCPFVCVGGRIHIKRRAYCLTSVPVRVCVCVCEPFLLLFNHKLETVNNTNKTSRSSKHCVSEWTTSWHFIIKLHIMVRLLKYLKSHAQPATTILYVYNRYP